MSAPKSKLTYEGFVSLFEEGRPESYSLAPQDVGVPQLTNASLNAEDAMTKLRNKVIANQATLYKAFQSFDNDYTGRMKAQDFRRIIDGFCFKLSDPQFKELSKTLTTFSDGSVDYPAFIENFTGQTISDATKWLHQLQDRLAAQTPAFMSTEDLQQLLAEKVAANFTSLAKSLADADYARIGVISKDDFRECLNKNTVRFNDEQFEKLWYTLGVNEFGNVDYRQFLQEYASRGAPVNKNMNNRAQTPSTARPGTGMSLRLGTSASMSSRLSRMSGGPPRCFTPMVNAESAENKLRDTVYRNWKDIQKQCRNADKEGLGQIHPFVFKGILDKYGTNMDASDVETILMKYDIKDNGLFCYNDFLRHFVLTMKSREGTGTNLLGRQKQPSPKLQPQQEKPSYFDAANSRVKQCVQEHWKDMRREFRAIDTEATGIVQPMEFRQVLRTFNVNLTEDEFYHIVTHYDHDCSGQVNYNNFVRAILKG